LVLGCGSKRSSTPPYDNPKAASRCACRRTPKQLLTTRAVEPLRVRGLNRIRRAGVGNVQPGTDDVGGRLKLTHWPRDTNVAIGRLEANRRRSQSTEPNVLDKVGIAAAGVKAKIIQPAIERALIILAIAKIKSGART